MINLINGVSNVQDMKQVWQLPDKQQPKPPKSALQEDTVSIKSTGKVDHDGDGDGS